MVRVYGFWGLGFLGLEFQDFGDLAVKVVGLRVFRFGVPRFWGVGFFGYGICRFGG